MRFRIKELRKAAGLTQEQLALAAGVTQPIVSQVERGRRPSLETLELFAAALHVDVVDLFERAPGDPVSSEILAIWDALSAEDREMLLSMARRLVPEK
ncbi:MAG: transcriptional regulator [Rhodobacteraceae bacterium]|nr:transcriptional regulator [Paracoccaceae bacterium]